MTALDPLHFDADSPRYDWLVITASNENQAANYREQLAWRKPDDGSGCDIPGFRRVLVVPDPEGKRAGSGGSTFAVIVELARAMLKERPDARSLSDLLGDQHVLILHSGGDARRLPPYAPQGKIFIPVPGISEDGRPLTLFDRVLGDFYSLPRPDRGRLIIGAGDLLLHLDFDRPQLESPGVIGVAAISPPDRGTRHGVYITDAQGHVTNFLQKPSLEKMQAAQAISTAGAVLVDTGVLSIDWPSIDRWMHSLGLRIDRGKLKVEGLLADILAARAGSIDLYEHVLCLLSPAGANLALPPQVAGQIKSAMAGTPFRAVTLKNSTFYHLGTSRELIEFGADLNWGVFFDLNENDVAILSSIVNPSRIFRSAFVENCDIRGSFRLDGMNVLVNVPAEATRPLRLDRASCAVWFPIDDDKWTLIRYPLDFDWKTSDPGAILSLLSVSSALKTFALRNRDELLNAIAPLEGELSAFHARLWNVGALQELESLDAQLHSPKVNHPSAVRQWLKSERLSLADLPRRVNLSRIRQSHSRNTRRWLSHHAYETLQACPRYPTARILEICTQFPELRPLWLKGIDSFTPPQSIRKQQLVALSPGKKVYLARLASTLHHQSLDAPWNPAVRQALAQCVNSPSSADPTRRAIRACTVSLPARIDLAGGWTDTPPICTDAGGLVVNLAIKLSGRFPVRASVRPTQARSITIKSLDQKQEVILPFDKPLTFTDTSDWSSIARAAISLTLAPLETPPKPLGEYLSSGLELSIESAVPKGSGLGTSSILAAALVSALRHSAGHVNSEDEMHEVARRVSCIEQIIGSCGGWQDQYGGLVPGLKSLHTQPGLNQTPRIMRFSLDSRIGELLRYRTLLYYTGQQRLAANILQKFLNRYLDRDPATLRIIRGIQKTASDLQHSISHDDPTAFVANCTRYWQLKSKVDSSATNPVISKLIDSVSPQLSGHLLPGAGGGGFLLFFANSPAAKQRIIDTLTSTPPNPDARFFDLEIDESGPQITMV